MSTHRDPLAALTATPAASVRIGSWDALRRLAEPLRQAVFVQEQGVPPQLELDQEDAVAVHAVLCADNGRAIATARLLQDAWPAQSTCSGSSETTHKTIGRIGRMAVRLDQRGLGLGTAVLDALTLYARNRGDVGVHLHAQVSAVGFYARHGYVCVGSHYLDAGIVHQNMQVLFTERSGKSPTLVTPAPDQAPKPVLAGRGGCVLEPGLKKAGHL